MTVCIAALYGGSKGVVLASDKMVTAHIPIGYEFEQQENAKIVNLTGDKHVYVLIAGDVLAGGEIIKATKQIFSQQPGEIISSIASATIRQTFLKIRLEKIVHQELEPRGLDLNTYYQNQQQISPQIVGVIDNELRNFDLGVQLIVAGRDENANYTIHTISNPGTIHDNSAIGHGSIGSGSPHAIYSLIENNYSASLSKEEVFSLVKRAKERSEVAPGVGKETHILSIP